MGNTNCNDGNKHDFNGNINMQVEKEENGTPQSNAQFTSLRGKMLFTTKDRNVFDYYKIVKKLGEGSMGSVSAVKKFNKEVEPYENKSQNNLSDDIFAAPSSDKMYALKSIVRSRVSHEFMDELRNEICILRNLDHPNIVKAYEVYESNVNIYLVLENCSGGDLYSRGPYSEKASAKIIGKLLSAILHMHQHGITHRDLKYENVMFESRKKDAEIKVIDFGLSHKCKPGKSKHMTSGVGTVYTMAPEIFDRKYTSQVDIWSIGVMTYMLLSSCKPFHGKSKSSVIDKIKKGKINVDSKAWKNLSQESKDFVSSLIVVNSEKRLTGKQALNHRWLSEEFPLSERVPDESIMERVRNSILDYGDVGLLKKMALMLIAHKSSSNEIVELRKVFDAYDTNSNGVISLAEFKAAMTNTNKGSEDIEKIFQTIDIAKKGTIYYTEFLAATLETQGRIVEETIAEAFDRIDFDSTSYISIQNLRDFLGSSATKDTVDQLMKEIDLNGDGQISFEEFLLSFRNSQSKKRSSVISYDSDSDSESESDSDGDGSISYK